MSNTSFVDTPNNRMYVKLLIRVQQAINAGDDVTAARLCDESVDLAESLSVSDTRWMQRLSSHLEVFADDELFVLFPNTTREGLAEYAHKSWTGWMEYLFDKSVANNDGTVTIPAWAVSRWKRQIETPYADLSAEEKASDRSEADQMLMVIGY